MGTRDPLSDYNSIPVLMSLIWIKYLPGQFIAEYYNGETWVNINQLIYFRPIDQLIALCTHILS